MNTTVTFVIGATASGKTTFIQNHFSSEKTVFLNVFDYQQAAYKEAGYSTHIPFTEEFKCLYKANENLLADIIETLHQGKNVVVEHTLFKAKRRIAYIEAIRKAVRNVAIEVYVMCPTIPVWEAYINKRGLDSSAERLKSDAEEIEFPNPSEAFNKIYEVIDNEIRVRMDASNPEIIAVAHKELQEEAERLNKEENDKKQRLALLESMNSRPFWHYCECCGAKVYCAAQEAFDAGWNYPPKMGFFGLLSPRTCGKCNITDTLFWKVQQQSLPLVIEKNLTEKELKTWRRIKKEPESLLTDENNLDRCDGGSK